MGVLKQNVRQIERVFRFLIIITLRGGFLDSSFTILELIHPSNPISSPGQQ
jgi:hypothetical protein